MGRGGTFKPLVTFGAQHNNAAHRAKMLARMEAKHDADSPGGHRAEAPGAKQRSKYKRHANATNMEKIVARQVFRKGYLERVLHDPELIRGGLLSEMLMPESDITDSPYAQDRAYTHKNMIFESGKIKTRLGRRKELRQKFKSAARAAAFGFMALHGGDKKKVVVDDDLPESRPGTAASAASETKEELKRKEAENYAAMTSRERAAKFFERSQRMSVDSSASPAQRRLIANRLADEATATVNMQRTNDYTRLVGLRNRKKLDTVERNVLDRLEAKYMGNVFVAEKNRKDYERREKYKARRDRISEIERRVAEDKALARDVRAKKMKRLSQPFEDAAAATAGVAARARRLSSMVANTDAARRVSSIVGDFAADAGRRASSLSPAAKVTVRAEADVGGLGSGVSLIEGLEAPSPSKSRLGRFSPAKWRRSPAKSPDRKSVV